MAEIEIAQLITKKKGRELIKTIPLEKLDVLATRSLNSLSSSKNDKRHLVSIMNNSMIVNVMTQISLLSLFNDTCPECGRTFTHYALIDSLSKINDKPIYILLPCVSDNDNFKFFNKDHIIPRSCNGSNTMNNLQFMCFDCNRKKSSIVTSNELKYGCYRQGIFKTIMDNNIKKIKIKQTNTKSSQIINITEIEQVKGGLFYLMSPNFNTYFDSNGISIDKKFMIRGVSNNEN